MNSALVAVMLLACAHAFYQLESSNFTVGGLPAGVLTRAIAYNVIHDANTGRPCRFGVKAVQTVTENNGDGSVNALAFGMNTCNTSTFQYADLGVGYFNKHYDISSGVDPTVALFGSAIRFSFAGEFVDTTGAGLITSRNVLTTHFVWLAGDRSRALPTMQWGPLQYYNVSVGGDFVHVFTMSTVPYNGMVFSARFLVCGIAVMYNDVLIYPDIIKLDVELTGWSWSSNSASQIAFGTAIFSVAGVGSVEQGSKLALAAPKGVPYRGTFTWDNNVWINGALQDNVIATGVYDDVSQIVNSFGAWSLQLRTFCLNNIVGHPSRIFWDPSTGVESNPSSSSAGTASAPLALLVTLVVALVSLVLLL